MLSSGPVLVVVEVVAKPGCIDTVLEAFRRSRAHVRDWPGCQGFEITRPEGSDDTLVIVERWDSAEQHAHIFAQMMASEGFQKFRKLLTKDPVSQRLAIVPAG